MALVAAEQRNSVTMNCCDNPHMVAHDHHSPDVRASAFTCVRPLAGLEIALGHMQPFMASYFPHKRTAPWPTKPCDIAHTEEPFGIGKEPIVNWSMVTRIPGMVQPVLLKERDVSRPSKRMAR